MSKNKYQNIKPIAFYLPQFYETEYNNKWWGEGFTEWTSCKSARPLYAEHAQPHLPADLGFHDQSQIETLEQQIALAKEYGVYGFCHYYYWFNGRRVLEKPTELFLNSKQLDMPFCLSWANENWSRRWDGATHEVLIEQIYDKEKYSEFASDLKPYFLDSRYIKSDGKVVFLVYRPQEIPDLSLLVDEIKKVAINCGHQGALVLGTETFVQYGKWQNPVASGLDGAIEFPPHGVINKEHRLIAKEQTQFEGRIYDHLEVYLGSIDRPKPDYLLFRGVFPGWDNTARLKNRAHIFAKSTPELFGFWLTAMFDWTLKFIHPNQQFIFINAWNEWAEGAHLEPSVQHGKAYLEQLRDAINCDLDIPVPINIDKMVQMNDKEKRLVIESYKRSARHYFSRVDHSTSEGMHSEINATFLKYPYEIRRETTLMLLESYSL